MDKCMLYEDGNRTLVIFEKGKDEIKIQFETNSAKMKDLMSTILAGFIDEEHIKRNKVERMATVEPTDIRGEFQKIQVPSQEAVTSTMVEPEEQKPIVNENYHEEQPIELQQEKSISSENIPEEPIEKRYDHPLDAIASEPGLRGLQLGYLYFSTLSPEDRIKAKEIMVGILNSYRNMDLMRVDVNFAREGLLLGVDTFFAQELELILPNHSKEDKIRMIQQLDPYNCSIVFANSMYSLLSKS